MTITETGTARAIPGRSLIEPRLFGRMSARIATEYNTDAATAEAIMDQALAFLGACAVTTTALSPSKTVDIGWHTFLLYTRDYAAFCERIAGRFIHHIPTDDEHTAENTPDTSTTTSAIIAAGYLVDASAWENAADCSQCKDGCSDDPPPDPKAV